jgi:hypothetical protein
VVPRSIVQVKDRGPYGTATTQRDKRTPIHTYDPIDTKWKMEQKRQKREEKNIYLVDASKQASKRPHVEATSSPWRLAPRSRGRPGRLLLGITLSLSLGGHPNQQLSVAGRATGA